MLRTAFGPTIAAALADPTVLEVMVNPDGRLWIDRAASAAPTPASAWAPPRPSASSGLVAAHVRREVTDKAPIVSAELPDTGERFEGIMPPVAPAPCFAIRKPAEVPYRLADYVAARILTRRRQMSCVTGSAREAQHRRRRRHLVGEDHAGQRAAGRGGDARASASSILEDTRELRCAAEDVVALRTKPGVAVLADLVRSTLRLRPDRIIVGEVRGAEALDMLKAWNTGHPGGLTTVHANSAAAALTRLEQLVQEAVVTVPRALIAEAIDLIVFIKGRGSERRVESILELAGLDEDGDYVLKPAAAPALHVV